MVTPEVPVIAVKETAASISPIDSVIGGIQINETYRCVFDGSGDDSVFGSGGVR